MSWPCPWQVVSECRRRGMKPCEPGAEGCVLAGRFDFPLRKEKDKNLRSSMTAAFPLVLRAGAPETEDAVELRLERIGPDFLLRISGGAEHVGALALFDGERTEVEYIPEAFYPIWKRKTLHTDIQNES